VLKLPGKLLLGVKLHSSLRRVPWEAKGKFTNAIMTSNIYYLNEIMIIWKSYKTPSILVHMTVTVINRMDEVLWTVVNLSGIESGWRHNDPKTTAFHHTSSKIDLEIVTDENI
jgi:hypothetical protein